MIVRTSTPEQTFEFAAGTFDDAVCVWVTYKQGAYKLRKTWYGNDNGSTDTGIEIDDDVVIVTLSQEETKNLRHKLRLQAQVKWIDSAGKVYPSEIVGLDVDEILDDDLMEGGSNENDSE